MFGMSGIPNLLKRDTYPFAKLLINFEIQDIRLIFFTALPSNESDPGAVVVQLNCLMICKLLVANRMHISQISFQECIAVKMIQCPVFTRTEIEPICVPAVPLGVDDAVGVDVGARISFFTESLYNKMYCFFYLLKNRIHS